MIHTNNPIIKHKAGLLNCVIHRHPFTIIGIYEQRNKTTIAVGASL